MKMSLFELLIYAYVAVIGTGATYLVINDICGRRGKVRSKRNILRLYNNIPEQFGSHENFYKSLEEGNDRATQYMGSLLESMTISLDDALTDPELRQVTDVILNYGKDMMRNRIQR